MKRKLMYFMPEVLLCSLVVICWFFASELSRDDLIVCVGLGLVFICLSIFRDFYSGYMAIKMGQYPSGVEVAALSKASSYGVVEGLSFKKVFFRYFLGQAVVLLMLVYAGFSFFINN